MAIATCNIKVNGRWVRAGETYEPETVQEQIPAEPEQTEPVQEEPKSATKARSAARRKTK